MRSIAIVPLWLGLMSSCLAAPSQITNFPDESGQYSFNYDYPMSSRSESRTPDGMIRGMYRYVDANGQEQTSEYEAGQDLGFNAKATNLPQAPLSVQETPEILAASQQHLQLLEQANREDDHERALQRNNQDSSIGPEIRNRPEGLNNQEIPGALLKFNQQAEINKGPQGDLSQQPENRPAESSRFNAPIPNSQIIPDANERTLGFLGFRNGPTNDFSAGFSPTLKVNPALASFPKSDAGSLPLPKGDGNIPSFLRENPNLTSRPNSDENSLPFPQGNADFNPFLKGNPNFNPFLQGNNPLPKNDASLQPLPKGVANFSPFQKESPDLSSLQKNDAGSQSFPQGDVNFNQFLKGNSDFSSLPKSDARPQAFPQGDANFNQLLKENGDFSSLPKSDAGSQPFFQDNADSNPFFKGNPDFNPFLQGNNAFPKNDPSSLPFPKGDANFSPFQKENAGQPALPKSDARPQPFPQGDANIDQFLEGNGGFSSLPKSDAGSPPLPKGSNFSPFSKENAALTSLSNGASNSLPLPKADVNLNSFLDFYPLLNGNDKMIALLKSDPNFLSLLKYHSKFLSSIKSDGSLLQLPKNGFNFAPLLKNDAPNRVPAPLPQRMPGETPEQWMPAPMPEPVKDTPEVAAAREAHLQAVAEATSKSAESVKNTPEVLAAREAHLKMAAQSKAPMLVATPNVTVEAPNVPVETPKYTPEVQAAREAHFRAYALAAKLARESDINPKILEELLGRPGEPKLGPQKIKEFESLLLSDKSLEGLKRLMENLAMKFDVPETETNPPKETLPVPNKATINLEAKPQLIQAPTPAQTRLGTGITPASTTLRIPDSGLSTLDEFEQSKTKAATDLSCETALKVKDLKNSKPTEDQRLLIIKSGDPAPFAHLSPAQVERLKNWAFQYTSL